MPATDDAFAQGDLYAAAAAAQRAPAHRPVRAQAETLTVQAEPRKQAGFKGFGGWNNLFPNHREDEAQPANTRSMTMRSTWLISMRRAVVTDASMKNDAINLVLDAGADFDDLAPADLERIASTLTSVARPRAVKR